MVAVLGAEDGSGGRHSRPLPRPLPAPAPRRVVSMAAGRRREGWTVLALPTGWTVRHLPSAPRCLEPSDPYITHGCDLKQARPGHTEETNRTAPRDEHAPPLTSPEAAASAAANRAPTAAMARSDADRELQCVPVDLDGVLLVLSACHQPATRGRRRWTVPGAGAVLIQSWRMMVQRKFKTGR